MCGEFLQARAATTQLAGRSGPFAAEILSVAHDAVSVGHGRDYRGFLLFFLELFRRNRIAVRVFDLRRRDGGGYVLTVSLFCCDNRDLGNAMVVDLVAYKHHMGRLKICEDNLASDVRDRQEDFGEHIRRFRVVGWEAKAELEPPVWDDRILVLNPCRFRKKHVEMPTASDCFYGEDTGQVAWGATHFCGMNAPGIRYASLGFEWRNIGPTCPIADQFPEETNGEFPVAQLQRGAELCDQLVTETGDARLAARGVQEIAMGRMDPQVQAAQELLQGHSQLSDEIVQLRTIGPLSTFTAHHPNRRDPLDYITIRKRQWTWSWKSGKMYEKDACW